MYLVGFRISGGLGIFSLFDIFHHFPYEGVAVVLILGHDNLKDKPQSPDKKEELTSAYRTLYSRHHFDIKIIWILQMLCCRN